MQPAGEAGDFDDALPETPFAVPDDALPDTPAVDIPVPDDTVFGNGEPVQDADPVVCEYVADADVTQVRVRRHTGRRGCRGRAG